MHNNSRGYSLIELMIVLVIIGMLLGLGVPGFVAMKKKSNRKSCELNLKKIKTAADQYRLDRNINFADSVNLYYLWNTDPAIKKDATKYITKAPKCPVANTKYVGNLRYASDSWSCIYLYVYADTSSANGKNMVGGPFCVDTTNAYKITGKGTSYPHYLKFHLDTTIDHLTL
ncbi:MAG: hypothetical protein ACD_79C01265G0001 [uncultured bacterium]|nr:MAG: hypothetical protein ACD_79C01265G0001 [uncultured bacterium]